VGSGFATSKVLQHISLTHPGGLFIMRAGHDGPICLTETSNPRLVERKRKMPFVPQITSYLSKTSFCIESPDRGLERAGTLVGDANELQ
jgi:hypothetical protein